MSAKMKTLEEQHTDYQRHIGVLKESLSAKEEHYTMLQADVSWHARAHGCLHTAVRGMDRVVGEKKGNIGSVCDRRTKRARASTSSMYNSPLTGFCAEIERMFQRCRSDYGRPDPSLAPQE